MAKGRVCTHIDNIHSVVPSSFDCVDCLIHQTQWKALRMCLICGYVGCSDDSKLQHARRHAHDTSHAVVESMEAGEDWRWCYLDEVYV